MFDICLRDFSFTETTSFRNGTVPGSLKRKREDVDETLEKELDAVLKDLVAFYQTRVHAPLPKWLTDEIGVFDRAWNARTEFAGTTSGNEDNMKRFLRHQRDVEGAEHITLLLFANTMAVAQYLGSYGGSTSNLTQQLKAIISVLKFLTVKQFGHLVSKPLEVGNLDEWRTSDVYAWGSEILSTTVIEAFVAAKVDGRGLRDMTGCSAEELRILFPTCAPLQIHMLQRKLLELVATTGTGVAITFHQLGKQLTFYKALKARIDKDNARLRERDNLQGLHGEGVAILVEEISQIAVIRADDAERYRAELSQLLPYEQDRMASKRGLIAQAKQDAVMLVLIGCVPDSRAEGLYSVRYSPGNKVPPPAVASTNPFWLFLTTDGDMVLFASEAKNSDNMIYVRGLAKNMLLEYLRELRNPDGFLFVRKNGQPFFDREKKAPKKAAASEFGAYVKSMVLKATDGQLQITPKCFRKAQVHDVRFDANAQSAVLQESLLAAHNHTIAVRNASYKTVDHLNETSAASSHLADRFSVLLTGTKVDRVPCAVGDELVYLCYNANTMTSEEHAGVCTSVRTSEQVHVRPFNGKRFTKIEIVSADNVLVNVTAGVAKDESAPTSLESAKELNQRLTTISEAASGILAARKETVRLPVSVPNPRVPARP